MQLVTAVRGEKQNLRPGSAGSDAAALNLRPKLLVLNKLPCIFHSKNHGAGILQPFESGADGKLGKGADPDGGGKYYGRILYAEAAGPVMDAVGATFAERAIQIFSPCFSYSEV